MYKLQSTRQFYKSFQMDIDCQPNSIEFEHSPIMGYPSFPADMNKCQRDFLQYNSNFGHMHLELSMDSHISNLNMILSADNRYFHCIRSIYIRCLDPHVNSMDICRMHDEHSLYIVH